MQLPLLGNVRDSDFALAAGLALAAGAVVFFWPRNGQPPGPPGPPPPPPPPGTVITMIQSQMVGAASGPQGTVFRMRASLFDQAGNPVPAARVAVVDNGAVLFQSSGFTDVNGQLEVDIPNLAQGTHNLSFTTLDGSVSSNAQVVNVSAPLVTEAGYPWGAVVGNVPSGLNVDIWIESNDIRFDIVDTSLDHTQYHLIRTFDPSGRHVKDYTTSLSPTDRRDYDPSGARISNVAGSCSICQYTPGTWKFYILVSDSQFPQDSTRPLKYGAYTCNLTDMIIGSRGIETIRV